MKFPKLRLERLRVYYAISTRAMMTGQLHQAQMLEHNSADKAQSWVDADDMLGIKAQDDAHGKGKAKSREEDEDDRNFSEPVATPMSHLTVLTLV
jgi:hypothetical protein